MVLVRAGAGVFLLMQSSWCGVHTAQVVFRGTNPESPQDICLNTMAKPTTVGAEGGALAGAEFHAGFLGACTVHKQRVVRSKFCLSVLAGSFLVRLR